MKDESGKKQPIDTEAPFFINAKKAADRTTMSKSGGYHMYFGINKETATPLFARIGLLVSSGAPSYICKTGATSEDKRIKVDFFCDTPHLIYEREEWDNTKGLTDKTQELYELIKANFSLERSKGYERSSGNNTTHPRRTGKHRAAPKAVSNSDAEYQGIVIEGKTENELKSEMTAEQREIFEDLKNIPADCNDSKWTSVAYCTAEFPVILP